MNPNSSFYLQHIPFTIMMIPNIHGIMTGTFYKENTLTKQKPFPDLQSSELSELRDMFTILLV